MKLYVKQKVFSLTERFTIKDEFEGDRYFVESKFLSLGAQMSIYDIHQRKVAFIKQRMNHLMPHFEVYVNEELVTTIQKKFSFMKPKYILSGKDWHIEGDIWEHDYSVFDNGLEIVHMKKEWFTWGDSYELDIKRSEDELIAVAVILAIDAAIASENSNN